MWAGCEPTALWQYYASNVIQKRSLAQLSLQFSISLSLALNLLLNMELGISVTAAQAYCLIPWAWVTAIIFPVVII